MTHTSKILALAFLAATLSTAAQAGDWSSASSYNGYGAGSQNTPSSYSMRDGNGNLTLVNGQVMPSSFSSNSGAQNASAGVSGVGTSGAGSAYGQATAIGNSLNVQVIGTHNTTIIDTQQINNGNQTATASITKH